jgi:hypothetical protein
VKAKGKCEGSCTGKCDVEMKAPQCSGEVKPPEMSAECKGNCDAKLSAELECTPPMVQVTFTGAADMEAVNKLKAALEADLPALLKVSVGMKGALEKAAVSVKSSVEGVAGAVKADSSALLKAGACIKSAVEAQVRQLPRSTCRSRPALLRALPLRRVDSRASSLNGRRSFGDAAHRVFVVSENDERLL